MNNKEKLEEERQKELKELLILEKRKQDALRKKHEELIQVEHRKKLLEEIRQLDLIKQQQTQTKEHERLRIEKRKTG